MYSNQINVLWFLTRFEKGQRLQYSFPVAFPDIGLILAQQAAGDAFEAVHRCRHDNLRQVLHQQVNVVVLADESNKLRHKVSADHGLIWHYRPRVPSKPLLIGINGNSVLEYNHMG